MGKKEKYIKKNRQLIDVNFVFEGFPYQETKINRKLYFLCHNAIVSNREKTTLINI